MLWRPIKMINSEPFNRQAFSFWCIDQWSTLRADQTKSVWLLKFRPLWFHQYSIQTPSNTNATDSTSYEENKTHRCADNQSSKLPAFSQFQLSRHQPSLNVIKHWKPPRAYFLCSRCLSVQFLRGRKWQCAKTVVWWTFFYIFPFFRFAQRFWDPTLLHSYRGWKPGGAALSPSEGPPCCPSD